MAVTATHPEYDAAALEWSRARDVLAGEDAVKAAGERYLPKLDSQSAEEYAAYRERASFFGATAHTLEEYLDLIFRRAPRISGVEGAGLKEFVKDCDLWGTEIVRYARCVVSEVLSVGRGGSLVFCEGGSDRPHASFWRAEDIINWSVERAHERVVLSSVVLRVGDTEVMVLKMGDEGCALERWIKSGPPSPEGFPLRPTSAGQAGAIGQEWTCVEQQVLKRGEEALRFIPFVFHGARHSRPEKDKLPLADIIAANLDHYRLDADYKHGLHFTALPTAWVSGFDKAAPLRIGSSTAWISEVPGASAGFLEFGGAGLGHIERAMDKVERRMALLGARMLEVTSPDGEASGGPSAELCGLGSIVASLNESLSRVLQIAQWWTDAARSASGPYQGGECVSFTMNTDLGARAMSGEEITAVVAAWRAGAISRDTMLERLKRGEVLPDGRSVAQERALIHGRVGS